MMGAIPGTSRYFAGLVAGTAAATATGAAVMHHWGHTQVKADRAALDRVEADARRAELATVREKLAAGAGRGAASALEAREESLALDVSRHDSYAALKPNWPLIPGIAGAGLLGMTAYGMDDANWSVGDVKVRGGKPGTMDLGGPPFGIPGGHAKWERNVRNQRIQHTMARGVALGVAAGVVAGMVGMRLVQQATVRTGS